MQFRTPGIEGGSPKLAAGARLPPDKKLPNPSQGLLQKE